MRDNLRDAIATDLPESPESYERVPFELDPDLSRRDSWMFAPLIAAAVTLPIIATGLFGFSAWHLVMNNETSAYSSQPTTFASRWPNREMPTIVVR